MARGTQSKNEIFAKLMEVYPAAFYEDEGKILRIPMTENGERVEVKVTLTAAKNNLGGDAAVSAFPEVSPVQPTKGSEPVPGFMPAPASPQEELQPTEAEKQNVAMLLKSLGL